MLRLSFRSKPVDNMGCHCFRDKEPLGHSLGSDNVPATGSALIQESNPNLSSIQNVPVPEECEPGVTALSFGKGKTSSPKRSQPNGTLSIGRDRVKLRDIRVTVGGLASCYEVERVVTTELTSAEVKVTQKKCWVQKCAVKTGKKDQCKSNLHAETLRHLDHPNILKVLDMLQDQNHCYAVYETTEGRSAEELAERTGGINEQWASTIMRQVLAAVRHCNSKGLVLESLSLKHVLFIETPTESCTLVKLLVPDKLGALTGYAAPELKSKAYQGPANDVWSCGVIMSALLAGEFMLRENSKSGVSQEFKGAYLKWQKVSEEAKSLALSMLARNYQKRPTLEACLQHLWLAVSPSRPALTLSLRTTLRSMSCITPASPLKKELLRLILNLVVSNEDLKVAIEAFRELDTDLDGAVSETELQTQLARLFPEKQAQTALTALSNAAAFSTDHKLVYSEFLLCACHETLSSNANIESLFRLLDKSKDKRVTAGEVRAIFCLEQSDSADCNAWTVLMQEIGKAREEPVTCANLRAFIQTGQEGTIGKRQR